MVNNIVDILLVMAYYIPSNKKIHSYIPNVERLLFIIWYQGEGKCVHFYFDLLPKVYCVNFHKFKWFNYEICGFIYFFPQRRADNTMANREGQIMQWPTEKGRQYRRVLFRSYCLPFSVGHCIICPSLLAIVLSALLCGKKYINPHIS
jgi:hypothetical protein